MIPSVRSHLPTPSRITLTKAQISAGEQHHERHATSAVSAPIAYERFLDCVHCGLCTSACPTYLETGNENDSPRGRIYLMRALTDGRFDLSDPVARHLDLCLDCRSCETACPSGVQYGRLIEPFRVAMHSQGDERKKASWFERWILYGMFPHPRRLRAALWFARCMQLLRLDRLADVFARWKLMPAPLARMHRLLPQLPSRGAAIPDTTPAQGTRRARVALFTGCIGDAMFHQVNRATVEVLAANGCEVVVPKGQGCCGAIHYHSGAGADALQLMHDNVAAFDPRDVDAIIVNVAGCGSMLKDYEHIAAELSAGDEGGRYAEFAAKVRDVSEFLAELGPTAPAHAVNVKATYHDACHLAHAQRVREQPRSLMAQVPGLELVPLAESDICCGAAGSYNLTQPEMADRLGARKRDNIARTGADVVVCANAGCTLQIQAEARKAGQEIRVVHPVEVLAAAYSGRSL